jgi:hypothetical protein
MLVSPHTMLLLRVRSLLSTKTEKGCVSPLQFSIYWIQLVNNPCKVWGRVVTLFDVYTSGIATLCTSVGLVRVN